MNKLDRYQPRKQNMVWQKVGLACVTALTWALGNLPISAQDVKFDNLPANRPAAAAPSLLSPVQPVSYNQPTADGAILGTATVRLPASSRYQLRCLNCEQFEKALVDCWMASPMAEAVDGGRSIRVWIPGSPENASMLIDRINRTVAFEGSANQTASWQAAIMAIDSMSYAQGKQSLRVMELNKLSPSFVRQVAYVASAPQDQQPALPGQSQQPE
jgi:hypothetical protein